MGYEIDRIRCNYRPHVTETIVLGSGLKDLINPGSSVSRVSGERDVDLYSPRLPKAEKPIGALILYGWIPPMRKVNHVVRRRQIQSNVASLG